MKRFIICILSFISLSGYAQSIQPEEVPSMVEQQKSEAWYQQQVEAWEQAVTQDPTNENAWYNLSKATRYAYSNHADGYQKRQAVYERMAKAIPNTYTYHFCAGDYGSDSISQAHMEQAYRLMPKGRKFGEEYGTFIAYFWKNNRQKELEDIARRYYRDQSVPSDVLRYNYNELQCLPSHAIYIGNGDILLLPKMALQYGLKVHQDKIIICASFLCLPDYYRQVCKQLGIQPEKFNLDDYQTDDAWKKFLSERISYIIKASGRPCYFSPSSLSDESGLDYFKENLYNEGLVLRYSEKPYDNFARVRENVEQNIRLDYLVEPDFIIEPEWQSANNLVFNYYILLSPLIQKYKEWGNPGRSIWLQNLLTRGLEKSKMDKERKKICSDYLKQFISL